MVPEVENSKKQSRNTALQLLHGIWLTQAGDDRWELVYACQAEK